MTERGLTLLEMLITLAIMAILASAAIPLMKYTSQRTQELALRGTLREIRTALDEFRRDWAREGELLTGPLCVQNKLACHEFGGLTGYPKTLQALLSVRLTGNEAIRQAETVRRYLRKIPVDPMTGSRDWGLRCYQDPPDAEQWCGDDVFDVFSTSRDAALDGAPYQTW